MKTQLQMSFRESGPKRFRHASWSNVRESRMHQNVSAMLPEHFKNISAKGFEYWNPVMDPDPYDESDFMHESGSLAPKNVFTGSWPVSTQILPWCKNMDPKRGREAAPFKF
jgi:hypothetical protein